MLPKSLKSEPMMQLEASQESLLVNSIPAEVGLFTSTPPVKLTLFLNAPLYIPTLIIQGTTLRIRAVPEQLSHKQTASSA